MSHYAKFTPTEFPSTALFAPLFLVTGILGAYTTFSSFEWETLATWKGGAPLVCARKCRAECRFGFPGRMDGFCHDESFATPLSPGRRRGSCVNHPGVASPCRQL